MFILHELLKYDIIKNVLIRLSRSVVRLSVGVRRVNVTELAYCAAMIESLKSSSSSLVRPGGF